MSFRPMICICFCMEVANSHGKHCHIFRLLRQVEDAHKLKMNSSLGKGGLKAGLATYLQGLVYNENVGSSFKKQEIHVVKNFKYKSFSFPSFAI